MSLTPLLILTLVLIGYCNGHGGGGIPADFDPNNPKNVFNDGNIVHDQGHIKDHLKEEIKVDERNMSPEELEFHYFRIHDTNQDNLLDGIEIMQALGHSMGGTPEQLDAALEYGIQDKTLDEKEKIKTMRMQKMTDYFVSTIDKLLEDDDVDDDGYLTYAEYRSARRKQAANYQEKMRQFEEQMKMDPQKLQEMQKQIEHMQKIVKMQQGQAQTQM